MKHRARRRFGQHFLHDRSVVERIVCAIDPRPSDTIVEIGPGQGVLTRPLAESGARLCAIEIDRDLAALLREEFAGQNNVSIVERDALEFEFPAAGTSLRIVGNLPYNVSTPLLFHLTKYRERIRDAHFMLQKEVVERMAAEPGTKTYGRLSVMLQANWQVSRLFDVGAGAFRPPPSVESSVVRLAAPEHPVEMDDPERFATLVRAAFGQRRKTLRNALRDTLSSAAIEAAGIDPSTRAETLSVRQFIDLCGHFPDKIER